MTSTPRTEAGLTHREAMDVIFDKYAAAETGDGDDYGFSQFRADALTVLEAATPSPALDRETLRADSLDEAWKAAEAALPEDRSNATWGLSRRVGEDGYYAWADDMGNPGGPMQFGLDATGPTPTAALRDLRAALSKLQEDS
jgi:hypothetical protein